MPNDLSAYSPRLTIEIVRRVLRQIGYRSTAEAAGSTIGRELRMSATTVRAARRYLHDCGVLDADGRVISTTN